MTEPPPEPPKPPVQGAGCLIGCVSIPIVLAVIFIVVLFIGPREYDPNNAAEAIAQCEDRIEEMLKAPATAEFNSNATGSGTWTVTGTVDAENSFGALVRSDYQCTVVIDGDRARTTVDYLE